MPESPPSAAEAPQIRAMRKGDAPALLALWEKLIEAGAAADPRYALAPDKARLFRPVVEKEWPVDKPFPRVFVATIGERMVGFVQGVERGMMPIFDMPRTALIGDLWVEADVRRLGIGKRLVEAWAGAARAAGVQHVEVGTLSLDERAVAFWTAMGFGPWRVILMRAG